MDSPVAKACMTRKIDDEVIVKRPKGDIGYTIVAVRYESEP
jgi:transcription elongation GreA/GreB family factor